MIPQEYIIVSDFPMLGLETFIYIVQFISENRKNFNKDSYGISCLFDSFPRNASKFLRVFLAPRREVAQAVCKLVCESNVTPHQ